MSSEPLHSDAGSGLRRADSFDWLTPHGEVARLIRTVDWSKSPLGLPKTWPQSLRTAINVCLASDVPMYVWWGPDHGNIYNDAYIPIVGSHRHPKFIGRPAREMWPEIWPALNGFLSHVYETGRPVRSEDQLFVLERNSYKEESYFSFSFNPAFDESGRVNGAIAIVQETTGRILATRARETAEKAVLGARRELHDFLMQAPIGIALLSGPEHVYTIANPMLMKTLFGGRPASDLLHRSARKALPELEGQGFFELLDDVYRTGNTFNGTKVRASILQANGQEREMYINFTYQARRDSYGKISGILVVVYEVTDQVNEQKEIEQLAENFRAAIVSRDTFLGIASHELNTPLTSLKLQVEMNQRLLDQKGAAAITPERLARLLKTSSSQIRRLGFLIEEMLDVSRINTGKLPINRTDTDLSMLTLETFERMEPLLTAAGSAIALVIQPGIHAFVDEARIEQVITNLVNNALKYAPGKPLNARLRVQNGAAVFTIEDQGRGISLEDQERIFGRFERAVSANEVSGLGLGLFICREIIRAHGGDIRVESDGTSGSTFMFSVPLAAG